MTTVLERPQTQKSDTDTADTDAHYFPKRLLADAMVFGTPIEALCGYVAVPYLNPDGRATCQKCHEIWLTKDV